ncbi:MAG: class I SAM-dependent methyltransferase [Magnetococcales bacterium]|nr:class I SAM-dependent methyltransferase [Magnetococcales bacterium]
MKRNVIVCCDDPSRREETDALAHILGVAVITTTETRRSPMDDSAPFYLLVTRDGFALSDPLASREIPFRIDFSSHSANRQRGTGPERILLRKALAIPGTLGKVEQQTSYSVIDATAGLGGDAFQCASLGAEVRMVERSPILQALLVDALKRGERDPSLAATLKRMTLVKSDAISYLERLESASVDAILLDPMYPDAQSRKAQVKKEMRWLRALVGHDGDAGSLLKPAMRVARKRVVVKRPPKAPLLDPDMQPTGTISGRRIRYDIYPPSS